MTTIIIRLEAKEGMSLRDDICRHDASMQHGAALVYHAHPSGVSHTCRVDMMLECSPGELVARATFMHHDDQRHDAVIHYAVLKGLDEYSRERR